MSIDNSEALEEMERLRLEAEMRRNALGARESMAEFSRRAWHLIEPSRQYHHGWHIDAICEHLEAVSRGTIQNLIINIPPRHMKSLLVSVLFPAWVWIEQPWKRFFFASYAANLAIRDAVKTRRIIESDWYRNEFRIPWELAADQNTKSKYANTQEGFRFATSVRGQGTGEGGDIIVIDDPHKATEAKSDAKRLAVLEWWDQEMSSRANDPKNVGRIIIMQRLHERDLAGHLLAKESGWEHLCLPAEYEPERAIVTSIGWEDPRRTNGELLWPARFGAKELGELKKELGSQGAAGQLQQRPAPAEGNLVKRTWWKWYTVKPARFDVVCQSWDLTFKDKETSDFVVGTIWGKIGADKYLLDLVRRRMSFTETLTAFQLLTAKWPEAAAKYVEDAANGAALIDTLRKKIPGIIAVVPRGSKLARAGAIAPQIEAGNIFLPDPSIAPYIHDYVEEWAVFPNGAHDDMVDSSSQGILKLSDAAATNWSPVSMTQTSKWLGRHSS